MKRELYPVKAYIGNQYDIEVLSNGRATTYVRITDAWEGTAPSYRSFYSRKKAMEYAEQKDSELNAPDNDPTPWCHICRAMTQENCHCPPYAENH